MGRGLAISGLLIGIAGLLLQFSVTLQASLIAGRSLPAAIEFFFSFFTILTNIAVVLVYVAALGGRPAWFARPRVRAGVAVSIAVVGITYATVLAQLWQPQGLFFIADTTLHYVTPALFVVWWLASGRSGTSRVGDIGWWLIYPLAYLLFAMVRGALIGQYPYPFLDLTTNSTGQVALSSVTMLGLFIVVSVLAIAVDRLLPISTRQTAS